MFPYEHASSLMILVTAAFESEMCRQNMEMMASIAVTMDTTDVKQHIVFALLFE